MPIILHEYPPSGNCYKLRLLMAHLGLTYERRGYDILKGETRTPEFMAHVNANGRILVLEIDGVMLPESNAALYYLAQGSQYWPQDKLLQAQVLQWLFFEQYNHEPNVATVRFWVAYVGEDNLDEWQKSTLPRKIAAGHSALQLMEDHLAQTPFFVGGAFSIADIALYAYTHVAPEGGFDLSAYPALKTWMARIAAQPHHVSIEV